MPNRGLVQIDCRGGDEFGKIRRVLGVLSELEVETLQKISAAHDHKGTLCIDWAKEPSPADLAHAAQVWATKQEYLLNHTYPDGRKFEFSNGELTLLPSHQSAAT